MNPSNSLNSLNFLTYSDTAVLLLSCSDAKGIVAEISNFIFKYNGNIIYSDQYSDTESNMFFMRIEWELTKFSLNSKDIKSHLKPIAKKFKMNFSLKFSKEITNSAIFVSKFDHCLFDLLLRHKAGELKTNIKVIVSNHMDCEHIARDFGLEFAYFPIAKNSKKKEEAKQIKLLKSKNIDLVILARYMQILSKDFVKVYENKIINIHHSFLPAFIGKNPYKQAFERGVKIIGASSHYITEKLDQGPIIAQDVTTVTHRDSITDMLRKGRDLEKIVLANAVRLHLNNKVLPFGRKTIVFS